MHDVVITVFGLTGLLALVSLLPPLANRLALPFTVLLAIVGCALGLAVASHDFVGPGVLGDFIRAMGSLEISADAFLFIFLPTLLFEAALTIDVRRLMDDVGPMLLLAVVAVVICTFVVGFALSSVSEMGLLACLLLGAIVATTDPAAVVSIFRDLGAPRRLSILVEGESLFNDAAAIALFSLLLAALVGRQEVGGGTGIIVFLTGFIGGGAFGYVAARAACALVAALRGLRLAEVTLTVALAYLVFVVADRYLGVSGVVAVVTAGLVVGSYGKIRITPSSWDSLVETWEQLGFWANSLIFLLAAMLVPRLLTNVVPGDAILLAVLVAATLGARALVLYGLLPMLTASGLANRIGERYKLVILWGGLRGAVSLALALAVTENTALPPEVRHFVAVLATGFVLFTLFVNGTTLRPLIRILGLDRLSPADRLLRDRALALALSDIRERVEAVAEADQIEAPIAAAVTEDVAARISKVEEAGRSRFGLSKEDLVYIGLVTLATQEERLYLQRFKAQLVSRRVMHGLVAQAGRLLDGAKTGGRDGYETAGRKALAFSASFRAALRLHHRFGFGRWLAAELDARFESLLISQMVLRELRVLNRRRVAPLLGQGAGDVLAEVLETRLAATAQALDALRLQYPDHARALEAQYLGRVALRLEGERYQVMLAESVISKEVYNDLNRRLWERRRAIDRRPPLDIAIDRETLLARMPIFAEVDARVLSQIARLLRPRLALPGERIVAKGERGDAMYFIASGAVEVRVEPAPVRLGSGDFFGEIALLANRSRTADVVALGYCQLLALYVRDFRRLLRADPGLRRRIDAVARQRLGEARIGKGPSTETRAVGTPVAAAGPVPEGEAQDAGTSRLSNTSLPSPGA